MKSLFAALSAKGVRTNAVLRPGVRVSNKAARECQEGAVNSHFLCLKKQMQML